MVTFTQGFSRKGTALCYLNRYEEAATVFMEGLEIDPDNQQLKNGLEEANSHLTGLLLKSIILFKKSLKIQKG